MGVGVSGFGLWVSSFWFEADGVVDAGERALVPPHLASALAFRRVSLCPSRALSRSLALSLSICLYLTWLRSEGSGFGDGESVWRDEDLVFRDGGLKVGV